MKSCSSKRDGVVGGALSRFRLLAVGNVITLRVVPFIDVLVVVVVVVLVVVVGAGVAVLLVARMVGAAVWVVGFPEVV
jgi:hypothetical protein